MFLVFSFFFFYLALHRSISLYLLQLNLTRFLFTCLFAVFSTLVPYLWLRPSRSGHGRPPVECRIQEARLFFFFCFLSFSEDHHIFCCPCGLILLFSSFGFSLAFVSSRTVKIKWNQTQQQQEIGVGVRYWTRLTSIYLSDPLRITSGMSFATFKA